MVSDDLLGDKTDMTKTVNKENGMIKRSKRNTSVTSLRKVNEIVKNDLHSNATSSQNQTAFIGDHTYCLSAPERLKICTINVCGLKSKLVYPEFEDLINEHDFV